MHTRLVRPPGGAHGRDEYFQAITCTGTDNQTQNKQKKLYRITES